jgi:uracil-DNA glycosylase
MLWGGRAQEFFERARPAAARPVVLRARHPSYDFARRFMAEGSHFAATADRVDWWAH